MVDYLRLSLNWNEGNLWKAIIKPPEYCEFKIVLFELDCVKSWESGENRKFDLKALNQTLSGLQLENDINYFIQSGVNYRFNKKNGCLDMLLD